MPSWKKVIISGSDAALNSLTVSNGITGSFSGSGANLFDIPASGIVGLNLSQISTGSITASVSTDTGSFTITSGSSNLLFISSSGNVGIGVTSPTRKLEVNGVTFISASAQGATSADSAPLIVQNNIPYSSPFDQYLQIWRNSAGTAIGSLRVDGSFLLAGGSVNTNSYSVSQNGNGTSVIPIRRNTTGFWFPDGNKLAFCTDGSEKARITDTGNLIIGTTTDNGTDKLQVSGSTSINGNVSIKSANLSNQENLDVDTGTEVVATVAIATHTAAFFDYVIKNGTNVRSGTVYACHDGTNVEYTETSTNDLGDTTDVTLSVDISSGDMRLLATTLSDNWIIKSLVRAI